MCCRICCLGLLGLGLRSLSWRGGGAGGREVEGGDEDGECRGRGRWSAGWFGRGGRVDGWLGLRGRRELRRDKSLTGTKPRRGDDAGTMGNTVPSWRKAVEGARDGESLARESDAMQQGLGGILRGTKSSKGGKTKEMRNSARGKPREFEEFSKGR